MSPFLSLSQTLDEADSISGHCHSHGHSPQPWPTDFIPF